MGSETAVDNDSVSSACTSNATVAAAATSSTRYMKLLLFFILFSSTDSNRLSKWIGIPRVEPPAISTATSASIIGHISGGCKTERRG